MLSDTCDNTTGQSFFRHSIVVLLPTQVANLCWRPIPFVDSPEQLWLTKLAGPKFLSFESEFIVRSSSYTNLSPFYSLGRYVQNYFGGPLEASEWPGRTAFWKSMEKCEVGFDFCWMYGAAVSLQLNVVLSCGKDTKMFDTVWRWNQGGVARIEKILGPRVSLTGKQVIESSMKREDFLSHLLINEIVSIEDTGPLKPCNVSRVDLFASWNEVFVTKERSQLNSEYTIWR